MEDKVAIVGCGLMGVDIAAIFVNRGWHVHIVEPQRAGWDGKHAQIRQAAHNIGGAHGQSRVDFFPDIASVPFGAVRAVIETVSERLDLKQRVFAELDALVPAGIPIGSNSSSMRISEIARDCRTAHRMANTHFFLPAHIVPLVEIARGERTSAECCTQLRELFLRVGRVPVVIHQDLPGFLANRIQHALMREAFSIIDKGLATPEDVNAAVKFGFGFRYVAAGPILQKEFAGLETQCAAASVIYPSLCNDAEPAGVLSRLVAQGKHGAKSGEGFRRWTPEEADAAKQAYESVLLRAAAMLAPEKAEL